MAVATVLQYSAAEMLSCLGLGLILTCVYEICVLIAGSSKAAVFIFDALSGPAAAVLLRSYAAGYSFSGQIRWYMLGAFLLGVWSGSHILNPIVRVLRVIIIWILSRPFELIRVIVLQPICAVIFHFSEQMVEKTRRLARKHHKKQLKKRSTMLYNSSN